MDDMWLISAFWLGLALAASVLSIWAAISVALVKILVGAVAGNLFGLNNGIIDQGRYTILVMAVIGSAVVPTLIAQSWFQPAFKPIDENVGAQADGIAAGQD